MNTKNFLLFLFLPLGSTWAGENHLPTFELQDYIVQSSPLMLEVSDSTQSLTVLENNALEDLKSDTIAQTLVNQPGISQTYYGPNANRSIIRGLDGFRVSILENGLNSFDLSSSSADHAVSIDTLLIDRLEILRGSSALLFGCNAIGGVINIFDKSIPNPTQKDSLQNAFRARLSSVNEGIHRGGIVFKEYGDFIFQINGSALSTEDYSTPHFEVHEEDEDEEAGAGAGAHEEAPVFADHVENSHSEIESFGFGFSYAHANGFVGMSYTDYDSTYGVPNHESSVVSIDRKKTALEGLHELSGGYFDSLNYQLVYGDYSHSEASGDSALDEHAEDEHHNAEFIYEGVDSRFILRKQSMASDFAFSLNYSDYDMQIVGDESYLSGNDHGNLAVAESTNPVIENESNQRLGIGLLQIRKLSDALSLNGGLRYEKWERDYDARDRNDSGAVNIDRTDDCMNGSIGITFTQSEVTSVSANFHYSERIPETSELYSSGAHHATEAFEMGKSDLKNETSKGVEFAIRNNQGAFKQKLSVYYNDCENFIFQNSTGEMTVPDHAGEEAFLIRSYSGVEANFYGAEYEFVNQLNSESYIKGFFDTITADNKTDNTALPRIPPWRLGLGYFFERDNCRLNINAIHHGAQSDIAPNETKTDAYTVLNARLACYLDVEDRGSEVYCKINNITDELGFVHTSFLKNSAPIPGRNVEIGINYKF